MEPTIINIYLDPACYTKLKDTTIIIRTDCFFETAWVIIIMSGEVLIHYTPPFITALDKNQAALLYF